MTAWFLGPKAEQGIVWSELINYVLQDYIHWRRNYFPNDPVVISRVRRRMHEAWMDQLNASLDKILNDLKAHFPFYSPRYVAHMLSEQTLPSVLGYFAGMLYNPNNVTDEAAPVTVRLELEVGRMVAEMLGFNPKTAWAHLCSGGTIANIEALWVARAAQFVPFVVREFCHEHRRDFRIKMANGKEAPIVEVGDRELLHLRPNESIFMLRKLALDLVRSGRDNQAAVEDINNHLSQSAFNVNRRGLPAVLDRLRVRPVIFASAAAHYSIRKAANALGYGEDAVALVPVDGRFRIDVDTLKTQISTLADDRYVAAVVGIVGTTEEGAVDPIHKLRFLRDEFARDNNRSFWLHVDAAWGGYFRSIFCGLQLPRVGGKRPLEELCDDYIKAIGAHERMTIPVSRGQTRAVDLVWADRDVYAAFLAMADADSITVDPHKMGYVPYPAGIVAFRNGLITELVSQKAQYISDVERGVADIAEPAPVTAVGPYILEGSKPGAAAASTWLAHKTVPLIHSGHGQIVRATVLSAKKLTRYLHFHKHCFRSVDKEVCPERPCVHPFTFVPLSEPDTNIVCFVAVPMAWSDGSLVPMDCDAATLNRFNESIYLAASIPASQHASRLPYAQPYFVSRTRLEKQQYSPHSIESVLDRLHVSRSAYAKHGLFVLRSTVMNPHYQVAEQEGKNYLFDFVKFLHVVARTALTDLFRELTIGKG